MPRGRKPKNAAVSQGANSKVMLMKDKSDRVLDRVTKKEEQIKINAKKLKQAQANYKDTKSAVNRNALEKVKVTNKRLRAELDELHDKLDDAKVEVAIARLGDKRLVWDSDVEKRVEKRAESLLGRADSTIATALEKYEIKLRKKKALSDQVLLKKYRKKLLKSVDSRVANEKKRIEQAAKKRAKKRMTMAQKELTKKKKTTKTKKGR